MAKSKYYKHPKWGHVYGEELIFPQGRLAWCNHLVTPQEPMEPKPGEQKGKPRYGVDLLIPKTDDNTEFFTRLSNMLTEMVALYNEGLPTTLAINSFVSDGDAKDTEQYPFNAGNWVFTARNAEKPRCINAAAADIDPATLAGGMTGRIVATPMITAKGVSYKLTIVQMISDDGTRFAGGRRDSTDLLKALQIGSPATVATLAIPTAPVLNASVNQAVPQPQIPQAQPVQPAPVAQAQPVAAKVAVPAVAKATPQIVPAHIAANPNKVNPVIKASQPVPAVNPIAGPVVGKKAAINLV